MAKAPGTALPSEYGDKDWELSVPLPIDPGVYPAIVKSVERKTAEADGRDWLAWVFVLDDGREIGGGSSYSLSVRSKSYAWISAIVGRAMLGGGATIHALDIVDHPCSIAVELDQDGLSSKVSAVLPPMASK